MSIGRCVIPFVLASALAGCTSPSHVFMDFNSTGTRSLDGGGTQFGGTIDGVMWYWNVSWSDVKDTPDWVPGEEPAISDLQIAFVQVTVVDGSYHEVDTDETAVATAAALAVQDALSRAKLVRVEMLARATILP